MLILIKIFIKKTYKTLKLNLNNIRDKHPEIFDWISKFGVYIFSFITSFMPVLALPNWAIYILIFTSFSSTLAFQWIALNNKREKDINETKEIHNEQIIKIRNEYDKKNFASSMVTFSHYISHKVKEITARIPITPNKQSANLINKLITDFFNESLNQIEELLSQYYCQEIRASIKLNSLNESFKTYGRGKNNIKSRGGETKIAILNKENIHIKQNYAYNMIINNQTPYFAEGDLTNIQNKINETDVFFCEYKDYLQIFRATIIIALRFPVFLENSKVNQNHEILGILCIDCNKCIPEWSDNNVNMSLGYHIIANYVDNLCILIKKYSDGMKKQTKNHKTDKNEKENR